MIAVDVDGEPVRLSYLVQNNKRVVSGQVAGRGPGLRQDGGDAFCGYPRRPPAAEVERRWTQIMTTVGLGYRFID